LNLGPKFFPTRRARYAAVGLVATILLSSCASPAGTSVSGRPQQATALAIPPPADLSTLTATPIPTQTAVALPVATSRGPNLEATDPGAVNLASGQLQLVEFFRFT
jgi:hypothetical protein